MEVGGDHVPWESEGSILYFGYICETLRSQDSRCVGALIEQAFRRALEKAIADYGLDLMVAKDVRAAFEKALPEMLSIKDLDFKDFKLEWPDFQTGSMSTILRVTSWLWRISRLQWVE